MKILKLNKKGFTLMEMLIVIAIIVILVAIIVPVMSGQTKDAEIKVAEYNIAFAERSLITASAGVDMTNIGQCYIPNIMNAIQNEEEKKLAQKMEELIGPELGKNLFIIVTNYAAYDDIATVMEEGVIIRWGADGYNEKPYYVKTPDGAITKYE